MCGCTSTHIPCICSYVIHMHIPTACYILSPTTCMYMYLYMYATHLHTWLCMMASIQRKRRSRRIPLCLQGFPDRSPSALDPDWGTSTIPKDTLILLHTHGQWPSTWGPVLSLFQAPFHPPHPGSPGGNRHPGDTKGCGVLSLGVTWPRRLLSLLLLTGRVPAPGEHRQVAATSVVCLPTFTSYGPLYSPYSSPRRISGAI